MLSMAVLRRGSEQAKVPNSYWVLSRPSQKGLPVQEVICANTLRFVHGIPCCKRIKKPVTDSWDCKFGQETHSSVRET